MNPYTKIILALAGLLLVPVAHSAPPAEVRSTPHAQPGEPTQRPNPQKAANANRRRKATLLFTATSLRKGYAGRPVGLGSLLLYEAGGQCALMPRTAAQTQQVTADAPMAQVTIPAEKRLVLTSVWHAGGSSCLVGNYAFTAKPDSVYKLTNVQDLRGGVCRLQLQRFEGETGRYVADSSLHPVPANCQRADGGL